MMQSFSSQENMYDFFSFINSTSILILYFIMQNVNLRFFYTETILKFIRHRSNIDLCEVSAMPWSISGIGSGHRNGIIFFFCNNPANQACLYGHPLQALGWDFQARPVLSHLIFNRPISPIKWMAMSIVLAMMRVGMSSFFVLFWYSNHQTI